MVIHARDLAPFIEMGMTLPERDEQWSLSPFMLEGEKLYRKYRFARTSWDCAYS